MTSMTVEAILLGVAQDAGVPQAGCYCPNCRRAWTDPALRQRVVCLGLVDRAAKKSWLIDATPDFKEQLHALHQFAPDCPLAGIILTHAHIGHYTGLIHLSLEAMSTYRLPLYATSAVAKLLRENAPWSLLVSRENISLSLLTPSVGMSLSSTLHLTPLPVPHRDELSDTMAFVIRGPARQLFYCPDIDSWDAWEYDLRDFLIEMDIALLDAPFFSADELPGRDLSQIPHPMATDTVTRLAGVDCEIILIHLNHSNPLYAAGPEQIWLAKQGVAVGEFGQRWVLG